MSELLPKLKKEIDEMPYSEMLNKWRFAPIGDALFSGESGNYFSKVMHEKKNKLRSGEHSMISKRIGWDK